MIKKITLALTILIAIQGIAFAKQKPNVILFIVDDLGWNDISVSGSKFYETPNIDKLANNGVRFTNSYAAHPRCTPSRYAMMTGKYPARAHIPGGGQTQLSEVTIAEALKENGYSTFFTGKWHLGHEESHWPHNQGFDVNKGGCHAGAPASYFFPYNKKQKDGKVVKPIYGLDEGKEGEFLTDRLTNETVKYISEHKDETFFACVAHYAVHTPIEAKPEKTKKYKEKLKGMTFEGEEYTFGKDGRQKMHQNHPVYAAMVESVDESLGKIVETLKNEGIYDNTIIIITSDHGGLSNSGTENKRTLATSNLPLRAGKGHCYEGGIKIPTIVYWNKKATAGSINESVITGADYYPTILEMIGAPQKPEQHIDGVSFVDALKNKAINKERSFYWHSPKSRPTKTGDNNCSVIRKGDYKLFDYYDTNVVELYNLKNDPNETNNIESSNKELAQEMLKELKEWKKEVKAVTK